MAYYSHRPRLRASPAVPERLPYRLFCRAGTHQYLPVAAAGVHHQKQLLCIIAGPGYFLRDFYQRVVRGDIAVAIQNLHRRLDRYYPLRRRRVLFLFCDE